MTPILFSVVLPGIIIVSLLAYAVLPRWIVVTGPDKLTHKDVPNTLSTPNQRITFG
ncbi:hypothetical protein [Saccharibacillus sacchari]|uniref:hypothetical protein n=1 Tax=Saccharibacillus sacchari TaxID=456493 RepID=UPI0004BABDB5|nr:hypothetical protein [Saccharibacillus sacchari]